MKVYTQKSILLPGLVDLTKKKYDQDEVKEFLVCTPGLLLNLFLTSTKISDQTVAVFGQSDS